MTMQPKTFNNSQFHTFYMMKLTKTEKIIFFAILFLGAFSRLYRFGTAPPGLNQDEAFAAYESWALLHDGVDSSLHSFPVYLTAWGSGMNALESYLMLPFLTLFGVKTWVIRLPQLLLGLSSVLAAFLLGRRFSGTRGGLCTAALLALCPWHILLSRWALESNMAPGLLLWGLVFFCKGLEDSRFLPLSALFYGLSLYAYSAIWPVMPLLLGLMLLCARPKLDRRLVLSGLILAALALPLVGFLAVNYGLMDEFTIGPFSVPKLVAARSNEVSLANFAQNLRRALQILLRQSDGLKWNSPGRFGLFYPVALPFALLGLGELIRRLIVSLREKRFDPAVLLLFWLGAGILLTALISVNINRMNFLLMPLALTIALGADTLLRLAGRYGKAGAALLLTVLLVSFGCFERYYFTDYADSLRGEFTEGWSEALDTALEHDGTVYVSRALHYPKLLLAAEVSPYDFSDSVIYERYPAQYLSPKSFDRFVYCGDAVPFDEDGVYVLWNGTDVEALRAAGFAEKHYGCFVVLYPKETGENAG